MNTKRKQELRTVYLRARREYEEIYAGYSCGMALAEHLNPRLSELKRRMDTIAAEVNQALRVV